MNLCTLAQVHRAMKLDDALTGKDEMIELLIGAMSEWIATYVGYEIEADDYTEDVYDGHGQVRLVLRRHPVLGIQSLKINGIEIDEADTVTDCGWILDGDILVLRGRTFCRGVRNIVVNTRWGYEEVPLLFQAACVKLVRYKIDDLTEHPNETYRMEAQNQYRWLPDAMPADVREMLDGARRMVI